MHDALRDRQPFILAHWHGDLFRAGLPGQALPAGHHRLAEARTAASWAQMLLRLLGARISAGSSKPRRRGGAQGPYSRLMREGHNCSFAVDGPRGPIYKLKPGVLETSRVLHCPIYYASVSCDRAFHWHRSWDRAYISQAVCAHRRAMARAAAGGGSPRRCARPAGAGTAGGADAAGQTRRSRARPTGAALKIRRRKVKPRSGQTVQRAHPCPKAARHCRRGRKARLRRRPRRAPSADLHTYQVVTNSIADMVSVVGEDEVYRLVNDAWCRQTGLDARARDRPQRQPSAARVDHPSSGARALSECLRTQRVGVVRDVIHQRPGAPPQYLQTTYSPFAEPVQGVRRAWCW